MRPVWFFSLSCKSRRSWFRVAKNCFNSLGDIITSSSQRQVSIHASQSCWSSWYGTINKRWMKPNYNNWISDNLLASDYFLKDGFFLFYRYRIVLRRCPVCTVPWFCSSTCEPYLWQFVFFFEVVYAVLTSLEKKTQKRIKYALSIQETYFLTYLT